MRIGRQGKTGREKKAVGAVSRAVPLSLPSELKLSYHVEHVVPCRAVAFSLEIRFMSSEYSESFASALSILSSTRPLACWRKWASLYSNKCFRGQKS